MSFPLFVSKRYTLAKKESGFITFISSIAIIGIALGVATLIIALSILNGFADTIINKIVNFDSHIQITSYTNTLPDYHQVMPQIEQKLKPYAASINPFASNLCIIGSRTVKEGVNIKGILQGPGWHGIKNDIVAGKFSLGKKSGDDDMVIGRKLADKLMIKVGDNVTVFALNKNSIPSPQNPPNIKRYKIAGIFESGMSAYDDLNAYVGLKSAQELFNIGSQVSGYDIKLNNISKIDSLTESLSDYLRYPYAVSSIYQIHRNIFTWINLQKKPIPIILGLIIIVAVFNIIGTLLMVVLEKTNDVGLLKSLGATGRQIRRVFLYQGVFLALSGILLGNILAYLLMFMQLEFNIITIPSSVYFMSAVPIEMSVPVFAGVSMVAFILCLLASFVPSYIASKIKPVSALRFG